MLIEYGEYPSKEKSLMMLSTHDPVTTCGLGLTSDSDDAYNVCGSYGLSLLRGTVLGGTANGSMGHYIKPVDDYWDYLGRLLKADHFKGSFIKNIFCNFVEKDLDSNPNANCHGLITISNPCYERNEVVNSIMKQLHYLIGSNKKNGSDIYTELQPSNKKSIPIIAEATINSIGFYKMMVASSGDKITTFSEYIENVHRRRPNLTILTKTLVKNLITEEEDDGLVRIKGVIASDLVISAGLNQEHHLLANKVVLCAGAIATPKLLLRSGIGSKHRVPKSVTQIIDSELVGTNLTDHYGVELRYKLKSMSGIDLFMEELDKLHLTKNITPYRRTLHFSKVGLSNNFEAGAFLKIKLPDDLHRDEPDYETASMPNIQISVSSSDIPISGSKCSDELFREKQMVVWVTINTMNDKEKGNIQVDNSSLSHDLSMTINHKWSQSKRIRYLLAEGIAIVRKVMKSHSLNNLIESEISPNRDLNFDTGELKNYIEGHDGTLNSVQGTCRFGTDITDGVIDHDFKVFGTNNLFICDASIFRDLTPSRPIPCIAVMAEILAHELD